MTVSRRSFLSRLGIGTVGAAAAAVLPLEESAENSAAPFPQKHGDNVVWPDHIMCKLCGVILYATRNHETGELFAEHVKTGTDGRRSKFCKNEGKKFKITPHVVSAKEV